MLPDNLQFSNEQLRNMSVEDVEFVFRFAKSKNCLEEFANYFWPAFSVARATTITNQDVIDCLEEYKRYVGRRYDKQRHWFIANKYNHIEDIIQYVCKQCKDVKRSSESYKLEVRKPND